MSSIGTLSVSRGILTPTQCKQLQAATELVKLKSTMIKSVIQTVQQEFVEKAAAGKAAT